jgi:ATP-binding cassette subfamily C protein CydCD
LIARASTQPPVLTLMVAIVAVRTFGLARPVLRYAERLVSHDAALRVLADRRAQVYDALVPLVPARLGVRRGDVLASVVDDVDAFVDERLRVRQPLWTAGLVAAGATLLASLLTPFAGLVVAAVAATAGLGAWLATRLAQQAESDFVRERAAVSVRVEELVHGARQLALWRATKPALGRLDGAGEELAATVRRSARGLALGRTVVVLGCGLGPVAMAAVVPADATSPALLALLVLLPMALADALLPAVDAGALSVRTRAARSRLDALSTAVPAVADPRHPRPAPAVDGIRLRNVAAGWDGQDALTGVSFALPRGRWLGVVGPSGSGKSTLAALLLRFLDPHRGSVELGGADLRTLALDDVRRSVGLVDDDPYVFASTLVENVRLARPDAADDEVETAIRAAHLGPWLDGLPEGLDTRLGEGDANVSGGERARIGIARALLADQPVLVLDEPTAHLDAATARAVTDDVLAVSHSRSVLWITHGTIGLDRMDDVLHLGDESHLGAGTAIRRAGAP